MKKVTKVKGTIKGGPNVEAECVVYNTRNLYASLRDRMRLLATKRQVLDKRRVTMEQVMNEALAAGLDQLERAS
jgi:hypothetical protein